MIPVERMADAPGRASAAYAGKAPEIVWRLATDAQWVVCITTTRVFRCQSITRTDAGIQAGWVLRAIDYVYLTDMKRLFG
jgi:hypothetical protein